MLTFSHLNADAFENPKKSTVEKDPAFEKLWHVTIVANLKCAAIASHHANRAKIVEWIDTRCAYSRPKSLAIPESARPPVFVATG